MVPTAAAARKAAATSTSGANPQTGMPSAATMAAATAVPVTVFVSNCSCIDLPSCQYLVREREQCRGLADDGRSQRLNHHASATTTAVTAKSCINSHAPQRGRLAINCAPDQRLPVVLSFARTIREFLSQKGATRSSSWYSLLRGGGPELVDQLACLCNGQLIRLLDREPADQVMD